MLVTPVLPPGTTVLSTDSSVLPFIINASLDTTRIEIGIYNTVYGVDTYTTNTNQNQFTLSVPLILTTVNTNVQIIGRNYDPTQFPNGWLASTSVAPNFDFADPNGNVQVVLGTLVNNPLSLSITSGTTGIVQPSWNTAIPANITYVSLAYGTSVIATLTAANNFVAGQYVYLTRLTNASFLNGQLVVVLPGVTPTQFQVAVINTPLTYLAQPDIGYAQSITLDSGVVWANIGPIAVTPIVKFSLLAYQSNLSVAIAPPSGITASKNQSECLIRWVTPNYPGFIGVRVMLSTDPAGINPPYTQFGDLVSNISSTAPTIIDTETASATNVSEVIITGIGIFNNVLTVQAQNTFIPGTVVQFSNIANADFLDNEMATILTATPSQFTASYTSLNYPNPTTSSLFIAADTGQATSIVSTNIVTNTNTVMETNYSSVEIPYSTVNNSIFYALFSTVIQDPGTNTMYESVQNGPLTCGFVNLQLANPTDFPVLQRKEDIAGRLITQITRQLPNLDLSPRSEIRDIFIDPFSIELASMSVREWFARVSESISAISQVDNVSGNGVSDPFQSSPYKQQIARAFGLSAVSTQTLINQQFDLLGGQAGLTRLGASTATGVATFYTYQQPQTSITIPEGAVIATSPDANTAAVSFTTLGQGVINLSNLSAFYNSQAGWWGVSVPIQCTQPGSIGNVGAGTITQTVTGVQAGVSVTNLTAAQYGTDQETNAAFAARIQARLVTGIDNSSRNGYLVNALSTPGIIGAQIVAAGDLDMLRDWDPTRQKHVFGCVDIYVRGTTYSEQNEFVPFQYANNGTYGIYNTYSSLVYQAGTLQFQIQGYNILAYPPYDGVELLVSRSSTQSFYLSLDRAQFVNNTVILNPNDIAYQYVGNSTTYAKVALNINNVPATNQAALAAISGALVNTYTFQLLFREKSTFTHAPALQPIIQVYSITGEPTPTGTGVVNSNIVSLIHTSDFLLNGGSNNAGDLVEVAIQSQPTTNVITASTVNPVLIDTAMDVPLNNNGNPLNVLSVLSQDMSTSYIYGTDYTIVPYGPYHQYGLQVLTSTVVVTGVNISNNVITVIANNEFGIGASVTLNGFTNSSFLNGQVLTIATASSSFFTATFTYPNYAGIDSGTAMGSAIQNNQQVSVTYNKFVLYERLNFVSEETQILTGSLPTMLDNEGFVDNVWLPQSYTTGIPTFPVIQLGYSLLLDGWDGQYNTIDGGLDTGGSLTFDPSGLVGNQVPYASRYIKVTYNNGILDVVMQEGLDFTLTVDPTTKAATITRILTGKIPDGATVNVSYFTLETFTFSTQYPSFVQVLATAIAQTQSACADVAIKAMVSNPIDITLTVTLNASTSPATVDPIIRTVIDIVLDNAVGTLYQSELITQIQSITGVQNIEIPLLRCAKSDGSYDIGVVIPTGTKWIPLSSDSAFAGISTPKNSWITAAPVLPDTTIPSGGALDAIVDFLYQGQAFQRALSIQNFLTNPVTVQNIAVPPGATYDTPGSFYIIGQNDEISSTVSLPNSYSQRIIVTVPENILNPGYLSYFCTYQVYNEGGASDVTVSPTEYLSPGTVTIAYQIAGQ